MDVGNIKSKITTLEGSPNTLHVAQKQFEKFGFKNITSINTEFSCYLKNYQLAIISKETFTPKSTIVGFTTINQGFNLSNVDSTNTTSLSRIWGTASNADALLVTGVSVPAANFLRSDISSTSNCTCWI